MMASREDRIANLASTLKASGLAKSEVQAKMMAEEMIGVEENVQKRYDEEHQKAQDFLKTAKNLGDPRVRSAPVQDKELQSGLQRESSYSGRRIELLKTSSTAESSIEKPAVKPVDTAPVKIPVSKPIDELPKKTVVLEDVHTDINMGAGSLKDLMLNQIQEDNHEVQNIEELRPVGKIVDIKPDAEVIVSNVKENVMPDIKVDELQVALDVSEENVAIPMPEVVPTRDGVESVDVTSSGLDGVKLREMMEEDGPLEEHTREIKEKPKDVKPKEDYVENTIDLSDMFNVNKK
jgi:hypothetical protein